MNFNAEEMVGSATELLNKLSDGVSVDDIFSVLQMPQLDQFSQLASSLLPQNLVSVDGDGKFKLLNPLELQETVKAGIDSLKDVITQEINDVIGEVTSIAGQATDLVNKTGDTLKSLGKKLTTDQLGFFDEAFSAASSMFNLGIDTGVVSNFANTVSTATDSIKQLSPKQIRDLANPEYLQKVVSTTLDTANNLLANEAISTAIEYAGLPVSAGSVTNLFATANTLLGGIGPKVSGEPYELQVRISTYYGKGEGGDLDAYNKTCATKQKLVSGKSCAVDNVKIQYNSKVEIPGLGTFIAVDRLRSAGVDVQLYYDDENQASEAKSKIQGEMVVKVTPPGSSIKTNNSKSARRGQDAKLI